MGTDINFKNHLGRTYGTRIGLPAFDPAAQAFITAAGITDPTQKTAINNLVVNLKNQGLWDSMDAIYPFVGGTATSHKYNLKDPRDLDAAYRLVFSGGWTHSSTGALPNGTNGYADTFFNPSVQITSTEYSSLSFYSRTNSISATTRTDMGVTLLSTTTGALSLTSGINSTSQSAYYNCDLPSAYTYSHFQALGPNTNTTGFYVGTMNATNIGVYKNGSLIAENTLTKLITRTSPNGNLLVGADLYNGSPRRYTDKQFAFAHIGKSIPTASMSIFYTIVQNFQTSLSRNI